MLQIRRRIAIVVLATLAGCQLGQPRAPVPLAVAGASAAITPALATGPATPAVPVANGQSAGSGAAALGSQAAAGSELRIVAAQMPATVQPPQPASGANAAPQLPRPPEELPPGAAQELAVSPPAPARLSLFTAIETSLAQNPDLVALRRNEGVGIGVLGVAQTYPFNPYVQVQATPLQSNPGGAGPGTVYHYVLLFQQVQLAHQQRYREESAMAALTSVRWNIHQAELLNLAQTERLFFTALYQRGIRDLAVANAHLNEELERVSQRQLEAGQASAADVAIVRLDARSTRRQAQLAEAAYQTAMLDVRRQLNLPIGQPLQLEGDLLSWQWRTPTIVGASCLGESLKVDANTVQQLDELVSGRPDVMAARADLAAARSNLSLARASRRPDLFVGPYYQRTETGTTYWGFRAQSDIPVINNGLPMVRQREAEMRQRSAVWQQLQQRAVLETEAAIDRYQRARGIVEDVQTDVTGSLPAELQRLEEQFKAGEVDIVRVFTARSSLLQLRRAQLDALNELAQAAANLTAASGLPPDSLLSPDGPQPIQ
jgi:cobalt-zinc-cadmium efflux system outer membrane protein